MIYGLLSFTFLPLALGAGGRYSYNPNDEFGPPNWGNVIVEGSENQCNGKSNSPISLLSMGCTDRGEYTLEPGDCKFSDLRYDITDKYIQANYPGDGSCTPPKMIMPAVTGKKDVFTAVQFHIHTSSEHDYEGNLHPAEIHIVHLNEDATAAAVIGSWISIGLGLERNEVFQSIIKGFQNIWNSKVDSCGQCDVVFPVEADMSRVASLYSLYNLEEIYHYSGGLTTPPCSEIVAWNFAKKPFKISVEQFVNLSNMLLAHRNSQNNCTFDTIAFQGSISRQATPLGDRKLHLICKEEKKVTNEDDEAPTSSAFSLVKPVLTYASVASAFTYFLV